jgi:capsid protein
MARRRDNSALEVSSEFRRAYNDYRADFDIGGSGRFFPTPRGVQTSGSGADYHYRDESRFFRGIERARNFDRNNMVVGQGINRLAANLVQDGFTLDVLTGDKDTDDELKREWYEWCEDPNRCDSEGEKAFYEMELLAARTIPLDGDIFCLPLAEEGSLQWLEAHRCRRPASTRRNCIHGVNLDSKTARRTSYFFTIQDIDPLGSVKSLKDVFEIDARDEDGEKQVLHLHWPTRFSQRRGITAFAPAALPIHYHDDIQFAALVAAQVQNCYAILEQETLANGPNLPPPRTGTEAQTGSRSTETLEDGSVRTSEGMSPGMRVRAKPGYTLTGFSPTIPGPMYSEHTLMILTIIAINLDLPVHVLLLDPSKTNFSGWRGAIEQARIRFRVMQRLLINRFHTPVWRWFVRQRLAESKVMQAAFKRLGPQIFGHAWHPPTWSYIEPHKDISANALELATLQTSPTRQRARQGEDFDDIYPEIIDDAGKLLEAAERKAQDLTKALSPKEPFTREEVLRVFTAGGVSVTATHDAGKDEPAPAGGKRQQQTNAEVAL